MREYVMALDQGTTSSRCIIFDKKGKIISKEQKEFEQIYPSPGWIEHNPMEIWSSQLGVAMEALLKAGLSYRDIDSIGITNQRETTIIWNKETGLPIYNAIVWQCRRTAPIIEKLIKDGYKDYVIKTTGLIPDAYFSASKIAWILDNVANARELANEGKLIFGTVDSWLVWNLTKGRVHVTDYTNASRTMLYDIHKLDWDDKLLEYFNIPRSMLPEVKPSSCLFGYSDTTVLGGEVPICGIAGDQQAALFGQCCFEAGEAKNTYGTGCFLLLNTGNKAIESKHGLVTTIAASLDKNDINYALEGSVFIAGASIQWLRDGLRMLKTASQSEDYTKSISDTEGVYFVPAFTGLGAPYWDPYARGTIVGLTRGCKKEHFIRATLEAIDYQVYDVLAAMKEDACCDLVSLKVDGGACANNFLMQFEADILNVEVHRPSCIETTALGAAYLAGLCTKYWINKEDIKNNWELSKNFIPNMTSKEREKLLKGWKRAVKCARAWGEDDE